MKHCWDILIILAFLLILISPANATQTSLESFETVNPVLLGETSALKCIYTPQTNDPEDITVAYTFADALYGDIPQINGVYTKTFTFNNLGNIMWTCTVYRAGYRGESISRNIIVVNRAGVEEYNETPDHEENYSISLLEEDTDDSLGFIDDLTRNVEILNDDKAKSKIGYLLLFLIVIYILMPKKSHQ